MTTPTNTGYGPVVDLAKDTKNAELVSEVRLRSLPRCLLVVFGTHTIDYPIPAVLEGWRVGRWCLPWARVSSLLCPAIPRKC